MTLAEADAEPAGLPAALFALLDMGVVLAREASGQPVRELRRLCQHFAMRAEDEDK
jgi:hypothetical protein